MIGDPALGHNSHGAHTAVKPKVIAWIIVKTRDVSVRQYRLQFCVSRPTMAYHIGLIK